MVGDLRIGLDWMKFGGFGGYEIWLRMMIVGHDG